MAEQNLIDLIGQTVYAKQTNAVGEVTGVRIDHHKKVFVQATWREFSAIRIYWIPLVKVKFTPWDKLEWTQPEIKACENEQGDLY